MEFRSSVVVLAVGGVFGAATSLVNDVCSPYGTIGSRIVGSAWAWAAEIAEVASLLIGQGWAWAGLAVALGWLAGTGARGAVAGVLSLVAATTAYYGMDSVLIEGGPEGRFAGFWHETRFWWLASVAFGPALGALGAGIGRPGAIGLLAGLTVPVGATVQTIWLPSGPMATPAEHWARAIVLVGAAMVTSCVIARFGASLKGRRMSRDGSRD